MSKRDLDIASLTTEERLSLLEELWDSLAAVPETLPLTEAQRAELDRRLDELDAEGPVVTLTSDYRWRPGMRDDVRQFLEQIVPAAGVQRYFTWAGSYTARALTEQPGR